MPDLTPRPDAVPPLVPGRSCERCTACCKLPAVEAMKKPMQKWCEQCEIGKGCRIYETRPDECRIFFCGWVLDDRFGEEWNPRHSKIVIKFEENRTVFVVDKDRKDAWRKEPFHSTIRQWAAAALRMRGDIVVWEGLDAIRVLPNGEQKLGRTPKL